MLVTLVAALEALVYLNAVPLNLAVCLSGGDSLRFGAGLSLFERRTALRRAQRRSVKPRKRRRRGKPGMARRRLRAGLRFARQLRLEDARLTGRVCLGDAAATALVCGSIGALGSALKGPSPVVRLDVRPDFSGDPGVELQGMLRARAGQIMLAAMKSAWHAMIDRIKKGG